MDELDFPEESFFYYEPILYKVPMSAVLNLVKSKDKKWEHEWDWFKPFFDNGYVKQQYNLDFDPDNEFWDCYQIVGEFVEPYDVRNFYIIEEMKLSSPYRIRQAMKKAKPNIVYLYKVWADIKDITVPKIPKFENIGNKGVKIEQI